MARMIPPRIHPKVKSSAEKRIFRLIQSASNSEDWVCLHSLGLAHHTTKRRGEIDFLLLTVKGVFVLEVKGGRVSRHHGVWRHQDRYGAFHETNQSPFDQASSAMFALETDIERKFSDNSRLANLLYGYGVMFPDILFTETGTDADPRQVYDFRDLQRPFSAFISRLASYSSDSNPPHRVTPNQKEIHQLVDFLRGDFDLVPSLEYQAESANEELLALEKEQYRVLDYLELSQRPRVLVQGSAGTGKTVLAAEVARREVRGGSGKALLTCYNRILAAHLNSKLKSEGHLVVRSLYSLLDELIQMSELAEEFAKARKGKPKEFVYRRLYPEYAALAASEADGARYRSLIIDEAQDVLTDEVLKVFDVLLEGGLEEGTWWVFCDVNNQAALFGATKESALYRLMSLGQVVILPTNWRNTIPIADETAMLSRARVCAPAITDGLPVRYLWYDSSDCQVRSLQRMLDELLKQGVPPSRISVLSPLRLEACCAAKLKQPKLRYLNTRVVEQMFGRQVNAITYTTVSSFKGMENDFIVLSDLEKLDPEWWRSTIYVGMSRARVGLYVMISERMRPEYERIFRSYLKDSTSFSNSNDLRNR